MSLEGLHGKRIVITGGSGFVGSHLADAIVGRSEAVTILDNLSTGSFENIEHLLRKRNSRVRFRRGDVRRMADCKDATKGTDIVFHLAAQINPVKAVLNPIHDFEVNARGTLNLLEAARRNDVKKVVFASTNVYGDPQYVPTDEDHPIDLLSPYAASKLAGEGYLMVYQNTYGIRNVRLRFSNIYGPRQTTKSESGVVAIFIERAIRKQPLIVFGDGQQTRDFVYVADVVESLVRASLSSKADGEPFNIGFGKETTIVQLAKLVAQAAAIAGGASGVKIESGPPRSADFRRGWMKISKAKKILGFHPVVPLRKGLDQTAKWRLQVHQ
jgi:UDP-glucose 4-epimerase